MRGRVPLIIWDLAWPPPTRSPFNRLWPSLESLGRNLEAPRSACNRHAIRRDASLSGPSRVNRAIQSPDLKVSCELRGTNLCSFQLRQWRMKTKHACEMPVGDNRTTTTCAWWRQNVRFNRTIQRVTGQIYEMHFAPVLIPARLIFVPGLSFRDQPYSSNHCFVASFSHDTFGWGNR